MAPRNTVEEKQIIKLLQQLQMDDAKRNAWIEQIQTTGLTEEIAEEIHQMLTSGDGEHADQIARTRHLMEFTNLVKRWRLSIQSKHFGRR